MDLHNIIARLSIVQLWEDHGQSVLGFGRNIAIIIAIIFAGKFVIRISRRLTEKSTVKKLKADETYVSALRVVIHYGVVIVCAIMILDILGVSTTSLIALLGAAGVAVAFALRDTLGNIAAGILIIFLRPFCKNDFIECGTVLGTVQEMGLFAAEIETIDGIFISVPNSNLWGAPLKNFSRNPKRRMDVPVTISYSNSIDAAFQVLREVIAQEPRFLDDPPPRVMVQSLGESGIVVTLRAWVSSDIFWDVFWDQMKNVKEKIQAAGLTIALPQRNIHLVKDSEKDFVKYPEKNSGNDPKEGMDL